MRMKFLLLSLLFLTAFPCFAQPKHEIRAVWLSTISSLDWPTGISDPQEQRDKMCELLDSLQVININTVIFQVQGQGDVLWESEIQPASADVTKDASKKLSYNICDFVIEECHKRNMECHADIVPYRLGKIQSIKKYMNSPVKHIYYTRPELCEDSRTDGLWLNPGMPESREYLVKLYTELFTKHKFDGISFDFTRYPQEGIDDAEAFKEHGGKMSLADWRRHSINTMVHEISDLAKSFDPYIKVGSAPIGTYKNIVINGRPSTNQEAFGELWQDACEWMQSEKSDLIVPQLYWDENYGFTPHMGTWLANIAGRQFVAGLAAYKAVSPAYTDETIPGQIEKVRATPGTSGVSLFRVKFLTNPAHPRSVYLYNILKDKYFKYPSHIVPMDFKGVTKPNKPENATKVYDNGSYTFKWSAPELDDKNTPIRYYCVYASETRAVDISDVKNCIGFFIKGTEFSYASDNDNLNFAVTAFDRNYYESDGAIMGPGGIENTAANCISFKYAADKVSIDSENIIDRIMIYSASGALVRAQPVDAKTACIECGDLSNGMYVVKAAYANGTASTHKIVR